MSAIIWARTVACDWPGCEQEGTVALERGRWPARELPAGWLDLGPLMIRWPDGAHISEFCPGHSSYNLAELAAVVAAASAPRPVP